MTIISPPHPPPPPKHHQKVSNQNLNGMMDDHCRLVLNLMWDYNWICIHVVATIGK